LEEVRRWRESKRTAAEYAAEHGLHAGTLAAWGSKIGSAGAESEAASRPVAFLPVRVAGQVGKESAPMMSVMEVVLLNGRRVRVGKEFDGDAVARLLDVAEGGRGC
jgi:hypothetical protein